jgi:hypothetical protein
VGQAERTGEIRDAYDILVGKPEGKRPLGKTRRRWEDNTKTDLWELGWGGVDWSRFAKDRDQWRTSVKAITSLRVPVVYCVKRTKRQIIISVNSAGNFKNDSQVTDNGITFVLNTTHNETFDVFTAVKIEVEVWDVTPCSVVVGCQRFGGTCCLHR